MVTCNKFPINFKKGIIYKGDSFIVGICWQLLIICFKNSPKEGQNMKKMMVLALVIISLFVVSVEAQAQANFHDVDNNMALIPSEMPESEVIEFSEDLTIVRDCNNLLTVSSPVGSSCLTVEGDFWGYCPMLKGYLFYDEELEDVYVLTVNSGDVENPSLLSLTTLKVLCR